jgi:hypothetical protein
MCYNHQVGDAVYDYVKAIGYLDYPHRNTKYHKSQGAEFRAKHITTKFYNKERETGTKEAAGILRQETSILGGKEIQRILGVRKPILSDVTRTLVMEYLNNDLQKLSLLDNSIGTYDTALNTLCDTYGKYAGPYYFSFLELKMKKSKKVISRLTNTHPRSLNNRIRKIVETGTPLTLTDTEKPLPPLHVQL